jgi:hypothetical protein
MNLIEIQAGFSGISLHFSLDDKGNTAIMRLTPGYGSDAVAVVATLRDAADQIEQFALERAKEARAARQKALEESGNFSPDSDPQQE